MIKFIVFLTKMILLTAISLFFASCNFKGIKGSGNVTTENRPLSENFTGIQVDNGLELILEQSNETKVNVVADDNLQTHIKTEIKNGILIVTSDFSNFYNVKSNKVYVFAPHIETIEASSGSEFKATNTIKADDIQIKSNGGSTIEIAIETEQATIQASGGSNIMIKGKAIRLKTNASSGSSIEAEKLLSNDISANASSGSNIQVYPLQSLNADASSGSSISYHNNPKTLNVNSSSGGSINKE